MRLTTLVVCIQVALTHLLSVGGSLVDWLVTGQIVATNPASSVRGPSHIVKSGKTPILDATEARHLLASIDVTTDEDCATGL